MPDPTHTQPKNLFDNELVFACVLTAIFLAAAVFNVLHHAMWRDETRAWQIALASPTISALHQNLRYEGVPILWYLILWVLTKITINPIAMQLVHVAIAACAVFTFLIAAPFGRTIKLLFTFGYFPFFEYATISRNYSLVFLFFLLGAAVMSLSKPRPILLAIVLALLAQVSIWGAGFAALMMVVALLTWTLHREGEAPSELEASCAKVARTEPRPPLLMLMSAIVIASCVAAYFESIPGPGPSYVITWLPGATAWSKFINSVGTVWKGWMPLPVWQRVWWNTNVLDDYELAQFIGACVLLAIAILCLVRRPFALFLLIVGLAAQIAFTYFEFCGFTRHHGQLFMVLIVACWIAAKFPEWKAPPKIFQWLDRRRNVLLGLLLAVHAVIGIGANVADSVLPFSAGKATAAYIGRDTPANTTLVGVDDYAMSPISTYLHRDFYFPQMKRFAAFNTQNDKERYPAAPASIFDDIRTLLGRDGRDVIFVHSHATVMRPENFTFILSASGDQAPRTVRVSPLKRFVDSTIPDETYNLYLFHIE